MSLKIKSLGFLNETIKGTRGLAFESGISIRQRETMIVGSIISFTGQPLEPGKEISLTLPVAGLLPSTDIKKLNATITIQMNAAAEKTSLTQNSSVKEGNTTRNFSVDIESPDLPRNVSVRLDGGDVFWTFSDAAISGTHDLGDFVKQANEYLDRLPPDGEEVSLKFLVKSDGPGSVRININEIEYSVIQTQSWHNPLDNTLRLDRTFQLEFGSIEKISLDPFAGSDALSLSEIKLDIGGEFGPERLLTSVEAHDGREFATISNDYSLAQSVILKKSLPDAEKPINVTGITGLFSAEAEAELYVAIQSDEGNSPSSGPPLGGSKLEIAPDEGKAIWAFANFESPVKLQLDALYWIVIKGIKGKARVGLQAQSEKYLNQIRVNRGGQLWKSFGGAETKALLRLVYMPEIDNQSAAVEIGIDGAESFQELDPRTQSQNITVDVPSGAGSKGSTIVIKSRARGALSIANVIQEYSPAGTKRLFKLVNLESSRASSK